MKFRKKQTLFFFFILLLFLILGANFLYALEIQYPNLPGGPTPPTTTSTLPDYVNYLFYLALWTGIILAAGLLAYAGFLYITAFNKPDRIISARQWVKSAVLGLLILFTSILVLESIDPQFTVLRLGPFEKIESIKKEEIPEPKLESILSSIHIKLPFSQLIMKIFENYISDISQQGPKIPRMQSIKQNAIQTLIIAEKLKEQNEQLKNLTAKCSCYELGPGNTSSGCTSDPCYSVREDVANLEDMDDIEIKNLEQIELLKKERGKTIAELKDLKIELNRLERVEKFIRYCPAFLKDSYAQFLARKKHYENQGGIVREFDFWDDISVVYLNKKGEETTDWATFACLIGGNALSVAESPFEKELEKGPEEEIKTWEGSKACSAEIPVGEIIDRAKRLTRLLIEKLENLISLDKSMIEATDQMEVLINQCSSQRCILQQGVCIGDPCPRQEIANQFAKIEQIFERQIEEKEQGIKNIVANPEFEEKEKKEKIGVIALINPDNPNSVVSKLLDDLDKIEKVGIGEQGQSTGTRAIRHPLQVCESPEYGQALFTCRRAVGNLGPEGKGIGTCCLDEIVFQECLNECYLENGGKEYKKCLQECLDRKSLEAKAKGVIRPEEIARCRHLLNFYCCEK